MNVLQRATCNDASNHEPLRRACSGTYPRSAVMALAAITMATAIAQSAPVDTSSAPPLLYSSAIASVDVDAVTLADQPNMHGIGAMVGPDGHTRLFCVDPSEHEPVLLLRQQINSGADSIRYE